MCCLADLPRTYYERLPRNPMADKFNELIKREEFEPYAYAAALFYYRSQAGYKKISQALKYRRNFKAGMYFAGLLAACLRESPLFDDADLVVPVPLHWTRRWKRGYNQAEIIAGEIASSLGLPMETRLLYRRRRTRSQTRQGRADRIRNASGAFAVSPRHERLRGVSHIILVDDVFTTGATISACYMALREIFPADVRISAVTLGFAESML